MRAFASSLGSSVTVKLAFVAFLVLVLLIPVAMIESVIEEREGIARLARSDIMQSFGRRQVIAGPLLVVPYRYPFTSKEGETTWHRSALFFSPQRLHIDGSLDPQWRYRGLHRLSVYTARLTLSGVFRGLDAGPLLPAGAVALWSEAGVAVSVSDARPIRERMVLVTSRGRSPFEPGGELIKDFPGFLVAPVPDPGAEPSELEFSVGLALAGSERIAFVPMGHSTRVELASEWSSPSFDGAYLPDERKVDEQGFRARWNVLNLGRGFPADWRRGTVAASRLEASAFGVRLYESAGVYQQATRAVKYAVLFVAFTFLIYFMMEIFARVQLHPLQYLLVGFANCMFYLLLVSLSEHWSFTASYLVAASACSALVAGYSVSVLGSFRRATLMLLAMGVLYGFLFVVLRAEDHALLMGTLALFAALASVMFLTRSIDWYGVGLARPGTNAA